MNEELEIKLAMYILPAAGFIAGFFMLRFSLKLKKKLRQRKEYCSIATEGTIVEVIGKYMHTNNYSNRHMYFPVYEYMANGEKVTTKSEYGKNSRSACQVGTKVELYYNPHNPTEIYVPADKADTIHIALFLGGLFFLFMVIISIVIAISLDTHGTIIHT